MCATCSDPSSSRSLSAPCTDRTQGGGATWTASNGKTCQEYVDNKWCTPEGDYGTGWPSSALIFSSFARGGVDATQACCGCGGGTTPAGRRLNSAPLSENWYWSYAVKSPQGASCDTACTTHGLVCDEAKVRLLLPAMDQSLCSAPMDVPACLDKAREEWIRIATAATAATPDAMFGDKSAFAAGWESMCGTPGAPKDEWTIQTYTHVPSFLRDAAYMSGSSTTHEYGTCGVARKTSNAALDYNFQCGGSPSQEGRRRLCYCSPPPSSSSVQTYSDTNDYAECLVSRTCPVGMGVTAQTNDANTVCTTCGAGFFSSKDDHDACAPHGTCAIGFGVFAQGTTSADTQCEQCVAGTPSQPIGTFSAVVGLGACTDHGLCDPGFGAQQVPTAEADTICANCADKFVDKGGTGVGNEFHSFGPMGPFPRMCTLHTTCPIGEGVVSSGTAFADTICEVCGSGKYVHRD